MRVPVLAQKVQPLLVKTCENSKPVSKPLRHENNPNTSNQIGYNQKHKVNEIANGR